MDINEKLLDCEDVKLLDDIENEINGNVLIISIARTLSIPESLND